MLNKLFKLLLITLFLSIQIGFLIALAVPAQAAPNDSLPNLKMPQLQINIPTLKQFSAANCERDAKGEITSCQIPWIAEYIAAIYKYAIGIVGILAAVVLMFGGIIWLTAGGSATQIGNAKAWIGASLTGLIIALTSYLILYQINPDLVIFKAFSLKFVPRVSLEQETTKYGQLTCDTPEIKAGQKFDALVTGYCRPMPKNNDCSSQDFLCAVGLNCSCPSGRNSTDDCSNSQGFTWKSCKPFDCLSTSYCNKTASGAELGPGPATMAYGCLIAAEWPCFPKDSIVCIGEYNCKVADKGSAIKGRRFDVWTGDDCDAAYKLTGKYQANAGGCEVSSPF